MLSYHFPANIQKSMIDGRPVLITPQGGKIATDQTLVALWEFADGRTQEQILAGFSAELANPQTIKAGLVCLCQAGFLLREGYEDTADLPQEEFTGPLISAVIIGYNSRVWLVECLPSLIDQTYSPIEIIVVDNGSQDDTFNWLQSNYPQVHSIRIEEPVPLSAAINAGVIHAAPESRLLILNPDIRLMPDAVSQMVKVLTSDHHAAAVGAKLRFWWAPAFLNGLGNQVGPFSWGTDNAIGHLDLGQFDHWQELPSACFAATLIDRQAWKTVGPVDDGFPMYYEDTEWCYRARLSGYKILSAPKALIYHAFGGKVPIGEADTLTPTKLGNVAYGRYRFALKLTADMLPRFIRNYWLEDWANFWRWLGKLDGKMASAYIKAWGKVLRNLGEIRQARRIVQARRSQTDAELFAIQRTIPMPFIWHSLPELTWDNIVSHYSPLIKSGRTINMPEFSTEAHRPHILIVSNDVVDEKMAGPGMRYLEMARALAGDLDVTLAVPNKTSIILNGIHIVRYLEERPASLQVLVENSDIALISTYMVNKFPFLNSTSTRLVGDLYDPTVLENLHYYMKEPIDSQQALNQHGVTTTNQLLKLGDFFICGNERQRDFWLGALASIGRVNPLTFQEDASLRNLIDVVGIGFPDRAIIASEPLIRGVHPQIPENARIVLWGGGIWNWLDPLTLIQAWPEVVKAHPEARLVFLGTRHPNPTVPVHEMAQKAKELAEETGELDRTILFIEWVSYADRENLLSEADIGVALHPIHVETRYSIRTRILDYIWARLPILITDGDITSEWVMKYGLGVVVPPIDPGAVADGLIYLLDRQKDDFAPAFEPLINQYRWSIVVEPLRRYCQKDGFAADRSQRTMQTQPELPERSNLARAIFIYRNEGLRVLLHRLWRHLQWRLSRP